MPPGYVSITSPPAIVRGVIVTGHQVLDGQRRDAPSGVIQAYDAITGKLRWAWDMDQPERSGLPPHEQTYTRGTPNMWTTATGDEALGLVYLPLGNSAGDYWSGSRTENPEPLCDVAGGDRCGHRQAGLAFPGGAQGCWDYDLGSQASLIDYPTAAGKCRRSCCRPSRVISTSLTAATATARPPPKAQVPVGGVEPEQRLTHAACSRCITRCAGSMT